MPDVQESKPLAFVLMPFDAEFEDVYTDLIAKPLCDAGFTVRRADSLLNQRNILADIVTGIADADLIVADVTNLNPNVMYELGLAHALGKRTVIITQTLELLPFDLRPYRANSYSLNFKQAQKIADVLAEIATAVLSGEADFGNPVQDYAPNALGGAAQVQNGPRSRDKKPHESLAGDAEEDESSEVELGFLDGVEMVQSGVARTTRASEQIAAETVEIGNKFEAATARLQQIQKNLGPDKALQPSLAAMRDTAKELEQFAAAVSPLNAELRDALSVVVTGSNAVARFRTVTSDENEDAVRAELENLDSLSTSLAESYFSASGFSKIISELPQMEAHMTQASRRAARVVAETASVLESAQADIDRVKGLLRERLNVRAQRAS